jgi:hypothetical protein
MPAILLQVAFTTTLLAFLENIGVFSARTLSTHHSQNVTILTPLSKLIFGCTHAFTASTRFKADFACNNISKNK